MANYPAASQAEKNLQSLFNNNFPKIKGLVPKHIDSTKMVRTALNTICTNPKLLQCEPSTIVGALLESAVLGLEIDSRGLAYLVPYGGKAKFLIGYKGLMDLAYRSGRVTNIYAEVIREGDDFTYTLGLNPELIHRPFLGERGELLAVYAVAKIRDADPCFVLLSKTEIDVIRQSSKTADNPDSPWVKNESEMWKKTAIRRLCKYLPLSPEVAKAVSMDEAGEEGRDQKLGADYGYVVDTPQSQQTSAAKTQSLNAVINSQPEKVIDVQPAPQPSVQSVAQPAPKAETPPEQPKQPEKKAAPKAKPAPKVDVNTQFEDFVERFAKGVPPEVILSILNEYAAAKNSDLAAAKAYFIQNPKDFESAIADGSQAPEPQDTEAF